MNIGVSYESLTEKEQEIYHTLDDVPYGVKLATAVAGKLKQEPAALYHAHRDYCGIGLYFFEQKFTLGEVNDGMGPHPVLATFDDEAVFVEWLARQSDQSMALIVNNTYGSRFNNQTITRLRLQWYLEEDYSPTWNAYAMYAREQSVR